MTVETECSECQQLRHAYSEATIRYMKFYNGERRDSEESRQQSKRLYEEMSDTKRALLAHQQEHAFKN